MDESARRERRGRVGREQGAGRSPHGDRDRAARAAPNAQSALVFEAYKQVLLEVMEAPADEWVRVRHRDGQQGYIRLSHVFGA
jgi:hypothetical protein